jgi:glycosyltransferase involved in cell wall biosynthesis
MAGGCARYYERLCAQAPRGSLEVLAPRLPGSEEADAAIPVAVHRRRVPTSPQPLARVAQCLLFAWHAARLVRRGGFVAVHLGHLYQLPVGVLLRRLFGLPYAVYLHGGESPGLLRWRAARALYGRWLRGAAAVAVNSEFTRKHYVEMGFELPKTVLLPPTVDPGRYAAPPGARARLRSRLGVEGRFVVLSVGRMVRRKAHDLLLRAVAELAREGEPVAAVVVGDGPERGRLETLARELGVEDRVRFAGFVGERELGEYYAAADAFAMPSRRLAGRDGVEGFGMVFLEAGAAGLPVIGAATGGIPEAVDEGRTGLLVPEDDVRALAAAIRRLAQDPQTAKRMGQEGRHRACRDAREAVEALWRASGWAPARSLRVLHVITRLVVGGAQENTLLSVGGLQRLGYRVELAAGPQTGPEGALPVPENVPFHPIASLVREVRVAEDLRALWSLYRLVRRGSYDVVHTHTSKAGVVGRLAARLAGVPAVVHTPHGHVYQGYGGRLKSRAFVWVEKMLARWTDVLVALTELERLEHLREGVGRPDQWTVIPSGVEVDRFRQPTPLRRTDLGLPEGGFLVGCVARLAHVKGVDLAIQAVARLRDWGCPVHLALVGDGPERTALGRLAESLEVGRYVHFLGLRRDVHRLLPLFDVLVIPSRNEGMGRVAVEAHVAGLPVVATRVGGIPDVVADGETGLLVAPEDPESLAVGLARLATDPVLRKRMAEAARERVTEELSAEAMVAALDRVYRRLAGRRLGRARAGSADGVDPRGPGGQGGGDAPPAHSHALSGDQFRAAAPGNRDGHRERTLFGVDRDDVGGPPRTLAGCVHPHVPVELQPEGGGRLRDGRERRGVGKDVIQRAGE